MYRAIAVWRDRVKNDIGNGPDVIFEIPKEALGNTPADALTQVLTYFENQPHEVHITWQPR